MSTAWSRRHWPTPSRSCAAAPRPTAPSPPEPSTGRPCSRSTDVNHDIVQKEVFGPVATFEVFDTEADAIARANATEFGLAAGIFTSSINTSRRVTREIQAGTIWTNAWAELNDGFAEGGYKQSGVGRLRGPLAITDFQEAKTVVHAIPPFQG